MRQIRAAKTSHTPCYNKLTKNKGAMTNGSIQYYKPLAKDSMVESLVNEVRKIGKSLKM